MKRRRARFRDSCHGCRFLQTEQGLDDPRVSPMVDVHAHDGRWNLPGQDYVYSPPSPARVGFRCAVDDKRVRQSSRCHVDAHDSRLGG